MMVMIINTANIALIVFGEVLRATINPAFIVIKTPKIIGKTNDQTI